MVIVETPIFTKRVIQALDDEQYRQLQLFVFLKNERAELSAQQLRRLRIVAEGEFS